MKKKFVVTLSIEVEGNFTKKAIKALIENSLHSPLVDDVIPAGPIKVRVRTVDVD